MSTRTLLGVSIAVGGAGAMVVFLAWINVIEWNHTALLVMLLLFASLFVLGAVILISLRSVRTDLTLVRDRSKSLVDNVSRSASRIEEIRQELLLGPFSHLPGQVGRLEGNLRAAGADTIRTTPERPRTPDEAFDAVFVINLAREADRMEHISAMLNRHHVSHARFAAIDGADPAFDDEWDGYIAAGPVLPPERYTGNRLIESRGAWGYLKTMHSLLSSAQRNGLNRILVFDDDISLHHDFESGFAEAWTELPDDWKIVYLGSAQVDRSRISRYSDHLYHPGAMANGSYAIAIASSVFDQALASIERFDWPFDAGALREIDAAYPSDVFVVDPPLVIADVSRTGIRPGRDMEAHATKHGWDLSRYEEPLDRE